MAALTSIPLVALDIGARSHAFATDDGGTIKAGQLENRHGDVRAFFTHLLRSGRGLKVIMEATGIYFLDTALIADELGAEVFVINPKMAHHFARSLGLRSKTDPIDARMLLEFLRRMPLQRWTPPTRQCLQLRQFGRYLSQLNDELTASKNRLHAMQSSRETPRALCADLRRAIRSLENRIERILQEALQLIAQSPELQTAHGMLSTMVGVADRSAVSILGELCVLPRSMTARACTSHAGLDVVHHQSGTSVDRPGRMSQRGNRYIRRALFMPAMCAGTRDPHARAFKERLLARGKTPMQCIVAIMRKMLTAAWAILRTPQPYDGARLYAPMKNA